VHFGNDAFEAPVAKALATSVWKLPVSCHKVQLHIDSLVKTELLVEVVLSMSETTGPQGLEGPIQEGDAAEITIHVLLSEKVSL